MPSLWPTEFGTELMTPPIGILREQAEYLGQQTQGLVLATVNTVHEVEMFIHHFKVVAPFLDNYTYVLFSVVHRLPLYPLEIDAPVAKKSYGNVKNEAEFRGILEGILNSEGVKQIVRALIVQSVPEPKATG